MKIKVITLWAINAEILEEKLNEIHGRIIKISDPNPDDMYTVIYESLE